MPEKKRRAHQPDTGMKMRPKPFHQMEEPGNDWLDRLMWFNLHFGRFARDALGVILVAFGLIMLLALTGWNQSPQGTRPRSPQIST